eukprot:Skav236596  [mRNA]  locus=scaffold3534:54799:67456:- [translate_table: standard]
MRANWSPQAILRAPRLKAGAGAEAIDGHCKCGNSFRDTCLYASCCGYAALKSDSSVFTFADSRYGGDSSSVDLSSGVVSVHNVKYAMAALKNDSSVVAWGSSYRGGSAPADVSSGVTRILSTALDMHEHSAFYALKSETCSSSKTSTAPTAPTQQQLAAEAVKQAPPRSAPQARKIAEVEAAEEAGSLDPEPIIGQVMLETSVGTLKLAAMSLESLRAAPGGSVNVSGGPDTWTADADRWPCQEKEGVHCIEGPVVMNILIMSENASANLRTDNVLEDDEPQTRRLQRLAEGNGSKIPVRQLNPPMRMVMEVDGPDASCAYWDEESSRWTDDGVKTVSINTKCSTFASLMDVAAFRKLLQPSWLLSLSGVSSNALLLCSVLAIGMATRWDHVSQDTLSVEHREHLLFRALVSAMYH